MTAYNFFCQCFSCKSNFILITGYSFSTAAVSQFSHALLEHCRMEGTHWVLMVCTWSASEIKIIL